MQNSLTVLISLYQGQRLRNVPHKALDESIGTLKAES